MKHCDDYIDDETQPICLRRFLRYHRWPATYRIRARGLKVKEPKLYADLLPMWHRFTKPVRVKVILASRLGDVGISKNLNDTQYKDRVYLEKLTNFSEKP